MKHALSMLMSLHRSLSVLGRGLRGLAVFALAFSGYSALDAHGAAVFVETFPEAEAEGGEATPARRALDADAGWRSRGGADALEEGGALVAKFGEQANVPVPETGSLVATNGTSGGAFLGDYGAAEIEELGFRFLAADVLPSSAIVRWHGPERCYYQSLRLEGAQVGEWVDCRFSLEGLKAGGWKGSGKTEEEFTADLADVRWVEVQVSRRGKAAQRYAIDDFYIGAKSIGGIGGGGHAGDSGLQARGRRVKTMPGAMEIRWSDLEAGRGYVMEGADEVVDGQWRWEVIGGLTATGNEGVVTDDGGARMRIYRLREISGEP